MAHPLELLGAYISGNREELKVREQRRRAQREAKDQVVLAQQLGERAIEIFQREMSTLKEFHELAADMSTRCPDLQDMIARLLQHHQRSYGELMAAVRQRSRLP